MTQTFTLEYWKDDGWLVGRLRGVPGVFSQGRDLEELRENIRDAFEMMMAEETQISVGSAAHQELIELAV